MCRKMDKCKDLSRFSNDEDEGQSVSENAVLVGCARSVVVSVCQKWTKEETVVNRRRGHSSLLKKIKLVLIEKCQNTQ